MDPADRTLVIGLEWSGKFADEGDKARRRGIEDLKFGFAIRGDDPSPSRVVAAGNWNVFRPS